MVNHKTFLLLIILILPVVSAAPAITDTSGSLVHDGTMTVTGSGFGVKNPVAPLMWDTFESGAVGNPTENRNADIGQWDVSGWSYVPKITATQTYAGNRAVIHSYSTSEWSADLSLYGSFPELYFEFKRYYPSSNGLPANTKPYRVYGNNDAYQLFQGYGCGYQVQTITGGSLSSTDWSSASMNGRMDKWDHYQIAYRASSTPNVPDGALIMYLNGGINGWNNNAMITRAGNYYFSQVAIGHYHDVGERDGCTTALNSVIYTDNAYIDDTWARLEIGNAPTYGASTKREIQIPKNVWNNSNIEFKVNLGSFTQTDVNNGLYLFVVDANGVASPGRILVDQEPVCGNSVCETGESLSCPSDCAVAQTCPNGVAEGSEVCDTDDLRGNDCTTIPGTYTDGTLTCNAQCTAFIESACTAPPQTEWIIDNGQVGTSSTGEWYDGFSGYPGYYGDDYAYSGTNAGNIYEWQTTLPEGNYEVSISWSYAAGRPASNTYNVYHDQGTTPFDINQEVNDNGFYVLGNFDFSNNARVQLISGADEEGASADAVRFVRVGDISGCVLGGYDLAPPCGTINIQDLTTLMNYYATTNTQYDYNNDGKINIIDLVTQIQHWN